jgi:hypothetical protein
VDGGSARRKASTYTQNNTNKINASDTHVSSGNQTHDPSVRASEDGSCHRPRGHCDRLMHYLRSIYSKCARFEVLTTVSIKITALLDLTPYFTKDIYRRLGSMCCLHHQDCSGLQIEEAVSFETPVII